MASDPGELNRRAARVRSTVTLSAVIGRDVKLTKAGNEHVGLCPFHADRTTGSFSVNDRLGIYKCFSCQAGGDVFKYLVERKGQTFMEALRELEANSGIDFTDARAKAEWDRQAERKARQEAAEAEKKRLNAWGLWFNAHPIEGTPAEAYLRGRGIDFARLGGYPRALRFRMDCWNSEQRKPLPAMVSAMILDGKHVATHRTYLEYRGGRWGKAAIDQPKMTLGKFTGGHIPLNKGKCGRMPLHKVPAGTIVDISEGIEDGLTVAMFDTGARLVAAATLGNVGAIVLPDAVSGVTLIQQNDDDYRALAARLARAKGDEAAALHHEKAAAEIDRVKNATIATHQAAGRAVDSIWPGRTFKDFNDELRGVRMEGA